jgi:hypothetical protein
MGIMINPHEMIRVLEDWKATIFMVLAKISFYGFN